MEEILAKLVAFPSITDDIGANDVALDYVERYLTERNMHVKRYRFQERGSLVATPRPRTKQTKIFLYGHTDVMPASKALFTLRREGDQLYGRGVYDMKFAIAGYLYAVDVLKDKLQDYDFAIMLTSDEEYGNRNGINGILHLLGRGYRAEVCILPDGGRAWDVEAVAKGAWRFKLTAAGRTAHGSRPWEGDSASIRLTQALHELHEAFKQQGLETDTLNISKIRSNGEFNQVPSQASAQIEMRLMSDASYAERREFVAALCHKHGLVTDRGYFLRPVRQDIAHPLVRGFMDAITRVTGYESKACVSCAASDAGHFNEAGIPCAITYLPGGGHHGDQEWISRRALLQFPEVILDYLERHARFATEESLAVLPDPAVAQEALPIVVD